MSLKPPCTPVQDGLTRPLAELHPCCLGNLEKVRKGFTSIHFTSSYQPPTQLRQVGLEICLCFISLAPVHTVTAVFIVSTTSRFKCCLSREEKFLSSPHPTDPDRLPPAPPASSVSSSPTYAMLLSASVPLFTLTLLSTLQGQREPLVLNVMDCPVFISLSFSRASS